MSSLRACLTVGIIAVGLAAHAPPLGAAQCQAPERVETAGVRELRLGVVCYGGVSLAVYMHGVTKEIQRLVVASRAFEDVTGRSGIDQENPFPLHRTEHQYFEVLRSLALGDAVRTEVIVDTIAGTSAGGINGVILAKSLALNRRQQTFRDLWLERGSLSKLLGWGGLRVPFVFVPKTRLHPLRGQAMLRWLVDAVDELDDPTRNPRAYERAGETLIPQNTELQLYVTTTDIDGALRTVALTSPPQVRERQHGRVMEFVFEPGGANEFDPDHNLALAFAARATSSFPGAFRPVSIEDVEDAARDARRPRSEDDLEMQIDRLEELFYSDVETQRRDKGLPTEARSTYFIDGGVLDNHPFGPVIKSVARRPIIGREVDRRMLFIEPDPKLFGELPGDPRKRKRPSFYGTLAAGLIGARSGDPILSDIRDVEELNETRGRIADLIAASERKVFRLLKKIEGEYGDWLSAKITPEAAAARRGAIEKRAQARAGYLWESYFNVRVTAVARQFASALNQQLEHPEDSNRARCVREIVRAWAERRGYLGDQQDASEQERLQRELVEKYDIGSLRRRLRFVAAGLGELYGQEGAPSRAALDRVRRMLGEHDAKLTRVIRGKTPENTGLGEEIAALRQALKEVFGGQELPCQFDENPGDEEVSWQEAARAFDTKHAAKLDAAAELLAEVLTGIREEIWAELVVQFREEMVENHAAEWSGSKKQAKWMTPRNMVLGRYFGFPFWDALIYPSQSLTGAWEVDDIAVVRVSPDDAKMLFGNREDKVVEGRKAGHFGAFFKRRYRENDYFWGRLDGVDLLIGLLTESGDLDSGGVDRLRVEGFRSVLSEEHDLGKIDRIKDEVETRIREIESDLPPACSTVSPSD